MTFIRNLLLSVSALGVTLGYSASFSEILVKGNTRIEKATILSYLKIKEGVDVTDEELNKSLEDLFRTGLFADVIAQKQGKTLVLQVVENRLINQIAFEGNSEINDDLLKAQLRLRPREVYTPARVQEAAQIIRDIYRLKGYMGTQVEPKLIERDQGRVDIVFEITEGQSSKIARISFVGNRAFTDGELQKIILTKESVWWRFLSSDDSYAPEKIEYDQELLHHFYMEHGYVDFKVRSAAAELSADQREFFITFHVHEGARYRLASVAVASEAPQVDIKPLEEILDLKTGDWFNSREIESTVNRLSDALSEAGHYFLTVTPEMKKNLSDQTLSVTFKITKTPPQYVGKIKIEGNSVTEDSVIRRNFVFNEGDPLNATNLKRSKQRMENLGFFKKVDVSPKNADAGTKDLVVTVEEQSTGSLMAGGGYSTTDGALLQFSASENNFRGKGQQIGFNGTISGRTKGISASFAEPYFLNRRLIGGIGISGNQAKERTKGDNENTYQNNSLGLGLSLGYELGERWFQKWSYRVTNENIKGVRPKDSIFIQDQKGHWLSSALSHTIAYTRLDSLVNPTDGYYLSLSNIFTGIGGNVRHLNNILNLSYYYPLIPSNGVVLNVRARGGYLFKMGKPLRVLDRHTLGGRSLLGFDDGGIGPKDTRTDDFIGGKKFVSSTVEVSMPVLPTEFSTKGYIFATAGSLWDSGEKTQRGIGPSPLPPAPPVPDIATVVSNDFSLRSAVGVGLKINSPLGLIGISFSKVLSKKDSDSSRVFRLDMGMDF
jgi:outer membrane protein insertion porin family